MGTVRLRHGDSLLAAVFGPGDKTLITAGQDSTLRVWDVATGKEVRRLDAPGDTLMALALCPDRRTLVGRAGRALVLWDLETRTAPRRLPMTGSNVVNAMPLALSPDGKSAATSGEDHSVRMWELSTGKELRKFERHTDTVPALAFAPDGRTLASGGFEGTIRLWSVGDGNELKQLKVQLGRVWSLVFIPDGRTLLCGGDGGVSLWDVAAGKKTRDLPSLRPGIGSLRFLPDGNLLAGSMVWDPRTDKEVRRTGDVFLNCSLSADGKKLVSW